MPLLFASEISISISHYPAFSEFVEIWGNWVLCYFDNCLSLFPLGS